MRFAPKSILPTLAFVPLISLVRGDESADLAQDLTNPLADLITLPIQVNYDDGFGPLGDGWRLQTNIQPVIPFELNEHWNLITHTIIPVIHQEDLFPGAGSQFGLGDINMSLFFSPRSASDDFVCPPSAFPLSKHNTNSHDTRSRHPHLDHGRARRLRL